MTRDAIETALSDARMSRPGDGLRALLAVAAGAPVISIQINLGDGTSVQFMGVPDNLLGLAVLQENQGFSAGEALEVACNGGSHDAPSQ